MQSNASKLPPAAIPFEGFVSAVYFLIVADEVVYIGQSEDLHGRIKQHLAEARKYRGRSFDRMFYILLPQALLLSEERRYLLQCLPRWNKTHVKKVRKAQEFREKYGY